MTTLTSFLVALSLLGPGAGEPDECPRSPADVPTQKRGSPRPTPGWLVGATRVFTAAYPHLRLSFDGDSLYVKETGTAYDVRLHYADDEASGFAALIFVYSSKNVAALRSGERMSGNSCRSEAELVVARVPSTGSPQILARGPLDHEASAIDVRTVTIAAEAGEPVANFFHHAYYGEPGWFGFVTWRSAVGVQRGRLVTQRLPASYSKVSKAGPHEMAGYLAPAGGDRSRGIVRLLTMAFGTKGEVEQEFDVPLVDRRWLSGLEILRRVP